MTHRFPWLRLSILSLGSGLLLGFGLPAAISYGGNGYGGNRMRSDRPTPLTAASPCDAPVPHRFLVVGGGGAPDYNEIALEKNVLYFQRTLAALGHDPAEASIWFANGTDGQATLRYLDAQGQIQFKVPEIPHLLGAATLGNLRRWVQETAREGGDRPIFFYFTGHGLRNQQNLNNNYMALWGNQRVSVQQLAAVFDTLPANTPVVSMMAQCYSGSFANLMYAGGDPLQGMAPQERCGFFATLRTLPSVGCTPEVNEADYEDYSSSFFAGLSGINRIGEAVTSADYNQDGQVAYAEAHAFAKVDEEATDLPVSTSEVWLQEQAAIAIQEAILNQPMQEILATARPEQRYVVQTLMGQFSFDPTQSYTASQVALQRQMPLGELSLTYLERLRLELINIGMEAQIRAAGDAGAIATLDRLLHCERGTWQ